jgi:hypothetical protein
MPKFRVLVLALLASCFLPGPALGAEATKLKVGFEPNRPGSSTTLAFDFAIDTAGKTASSPLVSVSLHFPAGISYDTSTLGEAGCDSQALTVYGVRGCPTNSRIGFGTAQVAVPLGQTVLFETVQITTFVGRSEGGQIEVLYYATGTTPVITELVFAGELMSETIGGDLNTSIPLISTLPEALDASIVKFQSTLGPKNLLYVAKIGGKSVRYHPRGIELPAACPRGGFVFSATFSFASGSTANSRSVVPCPATRRKREPPGTLNATAR